jgi:type IV secretion system protein VirB10
MSREADQERELARELRLRGDPPVVARLSRRALALLAGAACVTVAGIAGWAMTSHPRSLAAGPAVAAAPAAPPQQLADLPKDYASLPPGVPKLGPPLPGDLGRPILQAREMSQDGVGSGGSSAAPPTPDEIEARQARASRLFGSQTITTAPAAVPVPIANPASAGSAAQFAADKDTASAPQARSGAMVSPARLQPPASPYLLQAGTVIRAALVTGVRSDLPGQVSAQVTEDVFDSVTGRWRLIPQGARLVGTYDNQVAYGQNRVLLAWTRLILPDGRSIDLGRAPAADAQGYAGVSDQVDRKWRQLLGASLVSTILGVGSELGPTSGESQLLQALRQGTANSLNQAGQQLVGKTLGVQPTLTIRPGYPVRVLIAQDLVLAPWQPAP